MNADEMRLATHKRDGETVAAREVHFTNPKDFITELQADHLLHFVEDDILRVALTNGPAYDDAIDAALGYPIRGRGQRNPWYVAKYVEASYQARRQLIRLSCYCGIMRAETAPPAQEGAYKADLPTAMAMQASTRLVLAAAARLEGLTVRGGAMYIEEGPWQPGRDETIEAPPRLTCSVCEASVYWANNAWRHHDTGRAEVWLDNGVDPVNRRPLKKLDHVADPLEVAA